MTATIMQTRELARLTDEELLDTHYRERDLAARDELVDRFMPFARKLAIRYIHSREPMDDLVQVASIGLLNAIDRFDPRARQEVHGVRRADDPGRAQALLPRQGMGDPRPARSPGTSAGGQPPRRAAVDRAGSFPDPRRARRGARLHGRADSRGDRRRRELPADLARRARRRGRRRRVRTHGDARGRGRRVRTCRRPTGAREQLGRATRAGTPNTRPAPSAWSHAARDQPSDRILANARLPSTAQIDAVPRRR